MNCPECNAPRLIVNATRDTADCTYRRRECKACGFKLTTVEFYSENNLQATIPAVKRSEGWKRKERE